MAACHIYLIPLLKYPVFKVGNALNVNTRMKQIGIMKYADKKRIVLLRFTHKRLAEELERSLHRFLQAHKTDNIPGDIKSGRTEFFTNNAWDPALKLIDSIRESGLDYELVEWSREVRSKRPPRMVKGLAAATLRRKQKEQREIDVGYRYNRIVFCGYWVRMLDKVEPSFLGLRFTKTINEFSQFYEDSKADIKRYENDPTLSGSVRDMLIADCSPFRTPKWVLVYYDPEKLIIDKHLSWKHIIANNVYKEVPCAKVRGNECTVKLFSKAHHVRGITVFEVNVEECFSIEGTQSLMEKMKLYLSAANFPAFKAGEDIALQLIK